jgi:hypothetical protein
MTSSGQVPTTSPYELGFHGASAPGQVSTPRPRRVLRSEQAIAPTCSVLAVPPDFDGLLHLCAAGLLHPAADLGIHHVSGTASTTSNPCSPKRAGRSLPMTTDLACSELPTGTVGFVPFPVAPHPSKVSPPRQRPPLARAPAPSSLLSAPLTPLTPKSLRGPWLGDLDLEALLHLRVRGDVPV